MGLSQQNVSLPDPVEGPRGREQSKHDQKAIAQWLMWFYLKTIVKVMKCEIRISFSGP